MAFRVKEAREARGITQERLAETSGISRATICNLESGRDVITTTKTLAALARSIGCSVSDIYFPDDA